MEVVTCRRDLEAADNADWAKTRHKRRARPPPDEDPPADLAKALMAAHRRRNSSPVRRAMAQAAQAAQSASEVNAATKKVTARAMPESSPVSVLQLHFHDEVKEGRDLEIFAVDEAVEATYRGGTEWAPGNIVGVGEGTNAGMPMRHGHGSFLLGGGPSFLGYEFPTQSHTTHQLSSHTYDRPI